LKGFGKDLDLRRKRRFCFLSFSVFASQNHVFVSIRLIFAKFLRQCFFHAWSRISFERFEGFFTLITVSPGLSEKVCKENALPDIETCPPIER